MFDKQIHTESESWQLKNLCSDWVITIKKHFIAWTTVIIQTIQMTIKIGAACTCEWKHNHRIHYIFWIMLVCKTMFFINYLSFVFYYCMEWSPNKTKYTFKNKDLLCNITLSKNISISLFCLTFRNCKTKIIEQWKK